MSSTPRPDDPDPGLDVDAAFADIVAHYGEAPPAPETPSPPAESEQTPPVSPGDQSSDRPGDPDGLKRLFRPGWVEPDRSDVPAAADLNSAASWDEEGHFVPPPPPPLPRLDPRRKAAWLGLFGAPTLILLILVLQITAPGWLMFLLGCAFVGGFGYLVATMPDGGGSGYDDGARL